VQKILLTIIWIGFANICNAQNRLSQSVINNSAQINQLKILGTDSLPIAYNFCDSTLPYLLIQANIKAKIVLPNLALTITIRRKNKSMKLIDTKTIPLANILDYTYLSEPIYLDKYTNGNYILNALLLNNNVVIDSGEIMLQRMHAAAAPVSSENIMATNVIAENIELPTNKNFSDIKNSFVAKYSAQTILNYLKACAPEANAIEQDVITSLIQNNIDSTNRQFFYNFWEKRNPKSAQLGWEAYAKKLNFVANNYGGAGVAGYTTDRGRVYLKYGPPARSESISNEEGTIPYEVWQYDEIVNGKEVTFLFTQAGMLGSQMSLLHSTMPGEIYNPYWLNTLVKDTEKKDYRIFNYLPAPGVLNNR
jgi:GWxTD domain-containing protein